MKDNVINMKSYKEKKGRNIIMHSILEGLKKQYSEQEIFLDEDVIVLPDEIDDWDIIRYCCDKGRELGIKIKMLSKGNESYCGMVYTIDDNKNPIGQIIKIPNSSQCENAFRIIIDSLRN